VIFSTSIFSFISWNLTHWQWLGEDVSQLIIHAHEHNFNSAFCCTLTKEMVSDLNVLACSVMNWILDQVDCGLVVNLQQWRFLKHSQNL
jgi:hypothetical protein